MLKDQLDSLVIGKFFGTLMPKQGFALFGSSIETVAVQTAAHIGDTYTAYQTELENAGQSNAALPSVGVLAAAPYPSRMRPLNSLNFLRNAKRILLHQVRYYAYSSLITDGTGQDAAVFAEIQTSLGTLSQALPVSRYKNGLMVDWQPNYFRPHVKLKGVNVFDFYETTYWNGKSKGDLSIGEHLPFEEDVLHFIDGAIENADRDVEVHGVVGMYIPVQAKIVRFPLSCRLSFLYA